MNRPPNPMTADECCEGLGQQTPLDIGNRPGLSTLAFRVGTHSHFLESLLAGMARKTELARLRTGERDDPTIALCDAVATMLDVLSFYQERYLSETFLRTATESFSLNHLARQIAYVPAPAVAAGTYLAFTVEAIPGGDPDIQIPAGTRVQSVPGQDETPQTFETDQTIAARVAWNALRPRQTMPYPPREGATDIYLQGADTGLKVGDRLLFVGPKRRTDSDSDQWLLVTVRKVVRDTVHDRTKVEFDPPLGASLAKAGFNVYGLGERAAIYGHNAVEWRTLPETTMKAYLGLPQEAELLRGESSATGSGAASASPVDETAEWPNFTIFAPDPDQLGISKTYPPLIIEASFEKIAETAHQALKTQGRHSITEVITSVPDTVGKQLAVLHTFVQALQATGGAAADVVSEVMGTPLEDVAEELGTSFGSIGEAFNEGLASLISFEQIQFTPAEQAEIQALFEINWFDIFGGAGSGDGGSTPLNLNDLATRVATVVDLIRSKVVNTDAATTDFTDPLASMNTALENLLSENPIARLLNAITSLKDNNQFTEAWGNLKADIGTAVSALVEFPKSIEAAAATQMMGAVVGTTIEFLRNQKEMLRQQPENLAIAIMVAARLTELYIEFYDADLYEWSPPGLLTDEGNTSVDTLLKGPGALLEQIRRDLELSDADPASDLSLVDLIKTEFTPLIEQIFPTVEALEKAIEPFRPPKPQDGEAVEEPADGGIVDEIVRFTESGLGRGASDTRSFLAAHLAKALKSVNEQRPKRRPFPAPLTDQIDLDRVYEDIVPGEDNWALLVAEGNQDLYQISSVSEAARSDYLLNAKTTRLKLQGPDLKSLFEGKVRQTVVHAGSRRLTVAEGPLTTSVAGDRIEVEMDIGSQGFHLPRRAALSGDVLAGGKVYGEIIEVIGMEAAGDRVTWYLAKNLDRHYRRDTVVINANVASASHGESQMEILGSGDGSQTFQSFSLKQKPLTHLPGQGDSRFKSTLSVRVDDIEWQARPHLLESGPEAAVYTTSMDEEATVTLSFGDGLTGRRLPSGTNNVMVRYRKGAGLEGNLRAHQLTTLASRPLGVHAVDNPAPTSGGADGESRDELRQNIPAALLTMGRIVSLGDIQAYAAAYPGIGKAYATWLWDGVRKRVVVSVIAADGRPIDAAAPLIDQLKASMEQVRDNQQPVTIVSGPAVRFTLAAKLLIESTHDVDLVTAAVEKALVASFDFPAARFARGIRRSRVMAAIQAVPGVKAMDLDTLEREDGLHTAHGDLPAREAAYRGGRLQPAELLVVDPAGIALGLMTAR